MSTHTPRFPRAPHPTPSSSRKVPRAPIYNPYDQFTKPDFDAWIGDITGALKRALGREEPGSEARGALGTAGRDEGPEDEDVIEDSFAEVKARRAAKGKERAVDDGEDEARPIVVVSDEEEDELSADDDTEAQWGETFSGEEYSSGEAESDAAEDENEDPEEVINLLSDDEEDGDEPVAAPAEEVASASDNGEYEEGDGDSDDGDVVQGSSAGPDGRYRHGTSKLRHELSEREGDFHEQVQDEEDSTKFLMSEEFHQSVDLPDPWDGPNTFAEDFYSGGDVQSSSVSNPHILPAEEEDEIIDVDGDDDATDAPAVELPDPWDGPRTFAEDFYSGGELRESDIRTRELSPSHLTPREHEADELEEPARPYHTGEPVVISTASQTQVAEEDNFDDLYADFADEPPLQEGQYAVEMSPSPPRSPGDELAAPTLVSHVDWNWPPAFNSGRFADRPGHLESDDPSMSHEVYEISDDEEDNQAVLPSGTGHLEIPADFGGDENAEQLSSEQFSRLFEDITEQSENASFTQPEGPAPEVTTERMLQQNPIEDFYSDLEVLLASDEIRQLSKDISSGTLPEPPAEGEIDYADIFVQPLGFSEQPVQSPTQDDSIQLRNQAHIESQPPLDAVDTALSMNVAVTESDSFADDGPLPSPYSAQDIISGAAPITDVGAGDDAAHGIVIEESDGEEDRAEVEAFDLDESSHDILLEDPDDEEDVSRPEDAENDVVSVADEVAFEALEYSVEEPVTEGRRTEEPEAEVSQREPSAVLELDTYRDNLTAKTSAAGNIAADRETVDLSFLTKQDVVGHEDGRPTASIAARDDGLEQKIAESVMTDNDRPLLLEEDDVMVFEDIPSVSANETIAQEVGVHTVIAEQDAVPSDIETVIGSSEPQSDVLASLTSAVEVPSETLQALENSEAGLNVEVVDEDIDSDLQVVDVVPRHVEVLDMSPKHDRASGQSLSPGVPMPISADPEVPDPTSVSHTPSSLPSPIGAPSGSLVSPETLEDESHPDTPMEDPVDLLTPWGNTSVTKGTSGLFTPFDTDGSIPEDDSQPVSPRARSIEPSEEVQGEATSDDGATDGDMETTVLGQDTSTASTVEDGAQTPAPPIDIVDDTNAAELRRALEHDGDIEDTAIHPSSTYLPQAATDGAEDVPTTLQDATDETVDTGTEEPRSQDFVPVPDLHAGEGPVIPQAHKVGEADTDAEGDIDSDYVPHKDEHSSRETTPRPVERALQPALEDDPFKLMGSNSKVAPGAIEDSTATSEDVRESTPSNSTAPQTESHLTEVPVEKTGDRQLDDESVAVAQQGTSPGQSVESSSPNVAEDTSSGATSDESRPLKRKRRSFIPVSTSTRRTRSMAGKGKEVAKPELPADPRPPRAIKGKGKQKAERSIDEEDDFDEAETASTQLSHTGDSVSVRSGTSFSSRVPSRSTSRASSMNPDQSDNSSVGAQSFLHNASQGQVHPLPSQAFIDLDYHRHGGLRAQARLPPARRREEVSAATTSGSRHPSTESSSSQPSSRPSSSHVLEASRPRRNLPNSPATRSQCRYWRISMPREDGTRVDFVAPSCSLSNEQFMKEQDIQNHKSEGLDKETGKRLVGNIENLDLSSDLLGVLRQLVGLDLFRENEVYYLPQKGQRVDFKKSRRRSNSGKMRSSVQLSAVSRGSPNTARTAHPVQNRRLSAMRPPSEAGSASTSRSARRSSPSNGEGLTPSGSGDELSDVDADAPTPKRQRIEAETSETVQDEAVESEAVEDEARVENEVAVENEAGPSEAAEKSSAVANRRLRPRRGKPLGKDAAAYKPEEDPPVDSAEEDVRPKRRNRKKRSRADEPAEEPAESISAAPKRRRIRASTSGEKRRKHGDGQA